VSVSHLLHAHDIKFQVLEGHGDVLGRNVHWKMSSYCPERFIRFDVKEKTEEVMFIEKDSMVL
jgi:hypothetical protein